jgi:aminoglycoside phosphotransferase (APT) family kinase protein
MTDDSGDMAALLAAALATSDRAGTAGTSNNRVDGVRRLSGGANMETWALDWHLDDQNLPFILRRMPAVSAGAIDTPPQMGAIDLATEASLITLAASQGVSVPSAVLVLNEDHNLGTGYIMTRERGEALPSRILFDEKYAAARGKLAYQCGQALGRIHQIPLATVPVGLRNLSMDEDLDRLQGLLDKYGNASPVHQLGLNWLRQNKPEDGRRCLVHGDFRNGNLLVDEQGLVAVLDWELAHIGAPAEDLGYLCANVWRFGNTDKPVGGFGEYRDLLDGYRSVTGWAPSLEEIRYWEVYCALGWGIVCLTMIDMYRSGQARSLERAAVGRRMSESEIDLLLLLEGELPL